MGAILVCPGGEKGDVGLGGSNDEAVGSGPIFDGGEVGGQRSLQLLKVGRGADGRQVVCIGHCERGDRADGQEKVEETGRDDGALRDTRADQGER